MAPESLDALVIGAGQAGGPLSTALARHGWRTALVERRHVGGTCVNDGCTPTKTMIASARVAHVCRRAAEYGVGTGEVAVDMETVRRRKREIVETFRSGSRKSIESTDGVELIRGEARFTGPREVEVALAGGGTRRIAAERVFLNTGTRPRIPDFEGLDAVPWLDSTSIMELDRVPERLLVVGGGYVGLEFGQMFRRFGAEVTLVHRGSRLLSREDEDVSAAVAEILGDEGIDVRLGTRPEAVETTGNPGEPGSLRLRVQGPDGTAEFEGSHLLLAAGRIPNTDSLGPAEAGVAVDERGYVSVDSRLRTSAEGVWALGDVNGGPAFTHISYDDYRILRTNLIDGGEASTEGRLVPYTLFIDPQLGRVGMTETEARDAGHDVRVAKLPMSRVARALETDETRGFMKAVVDADGEAVLGAAILGAEGGEVMSVLQMAMLGEVPWPRIRDEVFAHPTFAESLNNLFMTLD